MISSINTDKNFGNIEINNNHENTRQGHSPGFSGGLIDNTIKGIQHCEKNPMLNVAVIDLSTAIIPRTVWESFTNIFAGFEAFRRESSGLIINCLLPGFIALGAAKLANNTIMGKNVDLSGCWAGNDSINMISHYYDKAPETEAYKEGLNKFKVASKARVYAAHYNMLSDASGVDGKKTVKFSDIKEFDISGTAEKLTEAAFEDKEKIPFSKRLKNSGHTIKNLFAKKCDKKPKTLVEQAFENAAAQTHITENVKFGHGDNTAVTDLKSAMKNSTGLIHGFIKDNAESSEQINEFVKKSKKLVKTKSGIAMAVTIPLAASMQYINRWLTSKMSGVKGAPIYDDYAENMPVIKKTPEKEKADKDALLRQKIISIGSMVGVACLSMMKLPTLSTLKNIVQFKGQFPTMDQARAISTVTFSSRMAAADDKNELAESTVRDIVTFSSMYFLGDYAAKGYASYLENTKDVHLLNKTKPVDKNANILEKAGNWIVNTHLKSTDELKSDSIRSLKEMKHLRAKCQMVNLGSSLLVLGLLVPVFTRLRTRRNHHNELLARQNNTNEAAQLQDKGIYMKNLKTGSSSSAAFTAFRQRTKENIKQ